MKTATFIMKMEGWNGDARLYKVSPSVEYGWDDDKDTTKFIIVSAVVAAFSGPETYIFPASKTGEIISWTEINGSQRGILDHEKALKDAGYKITTT